MHIEQSSRKRNVCADNKLYQMTYMYKDTTVINHKNVVIKPTHAV